MSYLVLVTISEAAADPLAVTHISRSMPFRATADRGVSVEVRLGFIGTYVGCHVVVGNVVVHIVTSLSLIHSPVRIHCLVYLQTCMLVH